ncbi:MAG: Hsp20 family protein [Rhizobiaceae bacterium]
MRHVDFSPLYRSTVGFDRLFSLLDTMGKPEQTSPAYPPYNIERTGENDYRISMAVAGFGEGDLDIEAKENTLLVKGSQPKDEDEGEMLFRGIAARNFERRFQLADHVEVHDAHLKNGLLHIDLVRRIPDAMKARKISISPDQSEANGNGNISAPTKQITQKSMKTTAKKA